MTAFGAVIDSQRWVIAAKEEGREVACCRVRSVIDHGSEFTANVLVERWRVLYNTVMPHGTLGYRPPKPSPRPLLARKERGGERNVAHMCG